MKRSFLTTLFWLIPCVALAQGSGPDRGVRLERDEIVAAHTASRAVFAAQKAERREAERVGLADLGRSIKKMKEAYRGVRAIEIEDPNSRAEAAFAGGAEAATVDPARAEKRALRKKRREGRIAKLHETHSEVAKTKEKLLRNHDRLRSPRQRAIAAGVLEHLNAVLPAMDRAVAEASAGKLKSTEGAALLFGEVPLALDLSSPTPPDPTFVTKTRHRRAIPRVP